VIGGFTDVVATTILAIPLAIYVMNKYDLSHASNGAAAIDSSIHSSAWLYGLQLAIGLGCSVLGGYVAARIAKHDELVNGLLSSFLCTAIGIYSVLLGKDSQSVRVQIFLLISAPGCALLGGYFRQTQKRIGHAPA
jgi:fructose-specific phosphotransferase system IIC component